ncbi:MAG: response regulator [Candidatus Omnitrophica bacterium]|nr:response regulator [Candidatus Omnitrophota bacterium]
MNENDPIKILIVDDDEDDHVVIRELLSEIKRQAYHLDWVADYDNALKAMGRNYHDVYFFDYRLGARTGLDLLRTAVHNGCKAPIILLTGQGDHDIDLQAMKMGAADYLVKGEMNALFLERSIRYALEHKKMENRLRVMLEDLQRSHEEYKKAENAVKVKGNFLANMSHEIRTPMNSILGFSELLGRTRLDTQQQGYLNIVLSSGKLLVGIIDDILNISKLEFGKIVLESSEFNLEDLILDVFKMIVIRMKDNPFDTYFMIAEDVPKRIIGDPMRLKQILVNLLGNAVKFTTKGEIGVIVQLEDGAGHNTDHVRLRFIVKDTGIGIPKDKQDIVFKSFSQADETTTRRFGGTGLGLAISKAIVEVMGGKIWVESEEGKGSRFIFSVAFKETTKPGQAQQEPDTARLLKGKKVFIIDDNQTAREIINKYCEGMGLNVVGIADSPASALVQIESLITKKDLIPDLVLCDLIMKEMDGFELVNNIRRNPEFKGVKYVAVTADMVAEISERAAKGTFDAYITKPVSLTGLMRVINKVMNIREEREEIKDELAGCEGVKILVVEDSSPNQALMRAYFNELKCEGDFANNGQEAIDKLRTNRYHLCLMDLHMPVMGGVEATKIIRREISAHMPIIALTAAVLEEDQKEAKTAGMDDFLAKPIDLALLAEKIMRYCKHR